MREQPKQRIVYTKRISKQYLNDYSTSLESVFYFLNDGNRHGKNERIIDAKILNFKPLGRHVSEYNCEILLLIEGDVPEK